MVINSVEHRINKIAAAEVDLMLTMDDEEAKFFNDRIAFGMCNIMHVDNFYRDNTVDIRLEHLTKGSGLLGSKPVFNSDSIFIPVAQVVENTYEPRRNGPIFHYVKVHGDIRDKEHYNI